MAQTKAKKKPAAKPSADAGSKRDKALEEVRARQEEIREHWRHHQRTEVEHTVAGINDSGEIRLSTADRRLFIEADGEVELDQDGVIDLRRFLESAFQAVS